MNDHDAARADLHASLQQTMAPDPRPAPPRLLLAAVLLTDLAAVGAHAVSVPSANSGHNACRSARSRADAMAHPERALPALHP